MPEISVAESFQPNSMSNAVADSYLGGGAVVVNIEPKVPATGAGGGGGRSNEPGDEKPWMSSNSSTT